jgi:release factor glutamine methyltransferase
LHPEFRRFIDKQPYVVTLDGLELIVEEDVFPPDMGLCARNLAKIAQRYRPRVALDMGCGTGYLALTLKRHGVPEVWASDIHPPAVACARKNVEMNSSLGPVKVVESDLFDGIPPEVKFDLIVFNQPFGPGQGDRVCGCGGDGGYEICKRFLMAAPPRLRANAVILMAFSDREPAEHSPDRVARELGYSVATVLHEYYSQSNNFIFEIKPGKSL